MKIERLNDRQIRCTLTREDLSKRGLRLSEFAYGTKKARALFQDMMEQASFEVGFEAEDYPLMIEAVPMGAECLVLIITQVDDPEELDTRFSVFGPMVDEADDEDDDYDYPDGEAEENSFYRLLQGIQDGTDFSGISGQFAAQLNPGGVRQMTGRQLPRKASEDKEAPAIRIFAFSAIHEVQHAAAMLAGRLSDIRNTLYRDDARRFFLCLRQQNDDKPDHAFISLCALLAEYGAAAATGTLSEAYLEEHCEPVISDHALQTLAAI